MTQLFAGGRTQLPGIFIIALYARKSDRGMEA